jgi:hypothetical protein
VEEPGQHLVAVLGREDLRQLDDARDAKEPVPERLDDLRDALDELGGGLPVVGSTLGESELAMEEHEETGVAELDPEAPPIEVGEGEEELGHRGVLAAEELGEAGGEFAGVRHSAIVADDFPASPNARKRVWTQRWVRGGRAAFETTLRCAVLALARRSDVSAASRDSLAEAPKRLSSAS